MTSRIPVSLRPPIKPCTKWYYASRACIQCLCDIVKPHFIGETKAAKVNCRHNELVYFLYPAARNDSVILVSQFYFIRAELPRRLLSTGFFISVILISREIPTQWIFARDLLMKLINFCLCNYAQCVANTCIFLQNRKEILNINYTLFSSTDRKRQHQVQKINSASSWKTTGVWQRDD